MPERDQRHASGVATASGLGPGIFVQRLNARFPDWLRMSARRERSQDQSIKRGSSVKEPGDRRDAANGANGSHGWRADLRRSHRSESLPDLSRSIAPSRMARIGATSPFREGERDDDENVEQSRTGRGDRAVPG